MDHFLSVDGVIAAQTPKIESIFRLILNDFLTIIEIGFNRGALSLWLDKNKNKKSKLVSYDITFDDKIINDNNIDFRLGDCFDELIINDIKSLIQLPGKTLLLCDGGNKEKEFEIYSKFLKKNDVIMLHDYAHSEEDYIKIANQLNWKTPSESKFENLQKSIKENNLFQYRYYNEFKNVLWGAFEKQ
jgi:hypothetical protein